MQSDLGKLFIGGISWDTDEDRLKEYFSSYGEVVESVIMKERNTGRARGFGFIVFADPAAADRVVKEKHNIDGRMVEAKKAVPRDDHNILTRNASSSIHASPGQGRSKKIFVGGLASSVTEDDFKQYFEQFGTITDVVVMYDHNTQRPRGFGFITYDSEESVDKVLLKTFHELNGKMVEVKRAVPKELSPSPIRSPLAGGYNYGLSRVNTNFLDGYIQGYSPGTIGNYGRFNPLTSGRSGLLPFNSGSGFGMRMNYEPGMNANFNDSLNYGRGGLNPYYLGNSNRLGNPIGYEMGNGGGNNSLFSSVTRDLWGNAGMNYGTNSSANSNAFMGSGSGNINIGGGNFGNSGVNWGPSLISSQSGEGNNISSPNRSLGYKSGDNNFGLELGGGYGRNIGTNVGPTSSNAGFDRVFENSFGGGSVYGDPTWRSPGRDGTDNFGNGLGSVASEVSAGRISPNYGGGYGTNKRQENRGVLYLD